MHSFASFFITASSSSTLIQNDEDNPAYAMNYWYAAGTNITTFITWAVIDGPRTTACVTLYDYFSQTELAV